MLVVPLVRYAIISKRNIADGEIEKAVGQTGFFEPFNRNVRRLVKLPCDSACDRVQFHTVELAVLHAFGQ